MKKRSLISILFLNSLFFIVLLCSWRAVVVVAVLTFSPSSFPFFQTKRKTKKSKEKQSKERQKAEQKEDNVLVLFLLPFHLFFIPFSLSPFSFPFFFPSFSIRHVCTHSSPRLGYFGVHKDAHFLLQGKEKNQRMMATEECSYPLFRGLRPISCADKYAHFLLQGKEKNQRMMATEECSYLPFRCFFVCFSFPMSAHESRGECVRVERAMSAHLLFFSPPFRGLRPRLVCG